MYKSLHSVPEPLRPPNRAALFSSNAVSVKLKHGGGASPVTTGEFHNSRGDGIEHNFLAFWTRIHCLSQLQAEVLLQAEDSITHLWTERKCVVHWYTPHYKCEPVFDTVLHVVVLMGQQDPTLPSHTRGPL